MHLQFLEILHYKIYSYQSETFDLYLPKVPLQSFSVLRVYLSIIFHLESVVLLNSPEYESLYYQNKKSQPHYNLCISIIFTKLIREGLNLVILAQTKFLTK
jgi:hypothetical protein